MKNSRLLISFFFCMQPHFYSCISVFADSKIIKSSSIAMNGDPKYPDGFSHFEYVNPDAPKGGTVKLTRLALMTVSMHLSRRVFLQVDLE
ncbi:MAG: hypothetical protein Ct9H300mP28_15400 [Pseudomonadota bacterium]|nr:MAG: hypothetical protein Ct9H300mP28_15400 [Pseudomonadota bacterium]